MGGGVGLSERPLSAADWLMLPSLSIRAQSEFLLKEHKVISYFDITKSVYSRWNALRCLILRGNEMENDD